MTNLAEHIEGVRRTLAAYGQAMDDGRYDDAARLFAAEARWTVGGATHVGTAAIAEAMSGWPVRTGMKHLTANSVIDVEPGGERARAVSDFFLVQAGEFGGVVQRAGRYYDILQRTESGTWVFIERENRGTSFVAS